MKKVINLAFKNIDDLFLSLSFIFVFTQHFFIVAKLSSISSVLYLLLFFIVFLWFVVGIINLLRNKKNESLSTVSTRNKIVCLALCISIFIFTVLSVIIDQLIQIHTVIISFEYYKKMIIFFEIVSFIFLCYCGNFTKTPISILKILTVSFSLFVILMFLIGPGRAWHGFKPWHMLTLNFHNPNACGLVLCVICSILFYSFVSSKNFISKAIYLSILSFLVFLLFLTECRNAIISIFIFFAFLFLCAVFKKNSLPLTLFIVVIPLLFVSVYMIYFFILNNGTFYTGGSVDYVGKNDSTRYSIWLNAINRINFIPFVGSYYLSGNGTGQFQWHNTEIDVLVGFGFVVLLLIIIYLIFISMTLFTKFKNIKTSVSFGIFCLMISLGIFEGFPFYSANALGLIPLSFIPLCMNSYKPLFKNENFKTSSDIDLLLVGSNSYDYINKYLEFLKKLNLRVALLDSEIYKSYFEQCFNKIFHKKFAAISTIRISNAIKELKPRIVEVFLDDSNIVDLKFISFSFKHSSTKLFVHINSKLPILFKERTNFYVDVNPFYTIDYSWENDLFEKHLANLKMNSPYIKSKLTKSECLEIDI